MEKITKINLSGNEYALTDSDAQSKISDLQENKVDKDGDKVLSSNDFTDEDKTKLNNLTVIRDINGITQSKDDVLINIETKNLKDGTTSNTTLPFLPATFERQGAMTSEDKIRINNLITEVNKLKGTYPELENKIDALTSDLETLISGDEVTDIIDTFWEIEDFLAGITNTTTLTGLLQDLKNNILNECEGKFQSQGNYVNKSSNEEIGGTKTFTNPLIVKGGMDTKLTFNNTDDEKYTIINFQEDGTDYARLVVENSAFRFEEKPIVGMAFKKTGGTSNQFLKADGGVDTNTYLPISNTNINNAVNFTNSFSIGETAQKIYMQLTPSQQYAWIDYRQGETVVNNLVLKSTKTSTKQPFEAPYFTATSDTLCTNLNADKVDGWDKDTIISNVSRFTTIKRAQVGSDEKPSVYPDANIDGNSGGLISNYAGENLWRNVPSGMSYGQILTIAASIASPSLSGQLAWDVVHNNENPTGRLWWRAGNATHGWGTNSWKQIAFINDVITKKSNEYTKYIQVPSHFDSQLNNYYLEGETKTNSESYFRACLKWICANYSGAVCFFSVCRPNSMGIMQIYIYDADIVDDNGLPQHSLCSVTQYEGRTTYFGTANYVWKWDTGTVKKSDIATSTISQVLTNQDLNNYKTDNFYTYTANSGNTCTNTPFVAGSEFHLQCFKVGSEYQQIITNGAIIYSRYTSSRVWSNWNKIELSSNVYTTPQIDLTTFNSEQGLTITDTNLNFLKIKNQLKVVVPIYIGSIFTNLEVPFYEFSMYNSKMNSYIFKTGFNYSTTSLLITVEVRLSLTSDTSEQKAIISVESH